MEVSFDLFDQATCLAGGAITTIDFFARRFTDLLVLETELLFVVKLS